MVAIHLRTRFDSTVKELEIRFMGHKLTAEHYLEIQSSLTLAASVCAVLGASVSYWQAFDWVQILSYLLASISTITAILNVVITKVRANDSATVHLDSAKRLEHIWITCITEASEVADNDYDKQMEIMKRTKLDISNAMKDAPLIPNKYERIALEEYEKKHHDNHTTGGGIIQMTSPPPTPVQVRVETPVRRYMTVNIKSPTHI